MDYRSLIDRAVVLSLTDYIYSTHINNLNTYGFSPNAFFLFSLLILLRYSCCHIWCKLVFIVLAILEDASSNVNTSFAEGDNSHASCKVELVAMLAGLIMSALS